MEPVDQLINAGQGMAVFSGNVVQASIVHIHS
jgi:hypothetical protein